MIDRRLVWISSQPTPYNDFLFRAIAEEVRVFEVWYRKPGSTSHPWKTPLGQGYRHRAFRPMFGADWKLIFEAIRRRDTFFMVAGWIEPTQQILLTAIRLLGRDFAMWTDTPNLTKRRGRVQAWLRSCWLKWLFRGAKVVLGTGKPGVEALEKMGVPAGRAVAFPFVLDLNAYRRTDWSFDRSKPMRFISSGRLLNRQKGHDLAIRALARASQETGQSFEYFIAGTGPDLREIIDLAKRLGVGERVTCGGWVEPTELVDRMKSAHVLIHSSPTHDPFPNAILEGMAAGMVVLGSDASGSARDRIISGTNGFVHAAGDEKQLCQQIVWCFQNQAELGRLGRAAEATANQWPVTRSIAILQGLLGPSVSAAGREPGKSTS
jgi:glycosyltransferase involved in cell wall biosynthesis